MSVTPSQARVDMVSVVRTVWLADADSLDVPIKSPDWPGTFTKPKDGPWANVVIQHVDGGPASLAGANGSQMYDRSGLLTVEIYTVPNDGLSKSDTLVKIVMDALDGQSSDNGVNFLNVRFLELGIYQSWEQVNVIAEFAYTEVK